MLTAITVCVNYADYLKETLPYLKQYVDRVVVITHPADHYTHTVADNCNVEYYDTTAFYANNAVFNKGLSINLCLKDLQITDWILSIDSDIVLLDELPTENLATNCIYGALRLKATEGKWRLIKKGYTPTLHSLPCVYKNGQYTPMGFFQLWNTYSNKKYPINCKDASKSDLIFAQQWPVADRKLLAAYPVLHLETEDNNYGINWKGRKTKQFAI